MEERKAELLPAPYFHVVYTLPAPIADIAFTNKAVVYDILFKASAEATLTIAADKKRLGVRIGITSVLHTWGSAMTHHPHVHMIVPGGGLSPDRERWVSCGPRFFLPVRVLWRLFRRLVIEMLAAAHAAGKLVFFREHAGLADANAFAAFLTPLERCEWVVYAKRPFAGPEAVLAYLSLYTHRIAISNRRLLSADTNTVSFKYKDYRVDGPERFKVMRLATGEFIRRFLSHVLPKGFHRIRHYGLLANGNRADNVARARELLAVPAQPSEPETESADDVPRIHPRACPCCGSRMLVIEVFERGTTPKHRKHPVSLSITHKYRDPQGRSGNEILESSESVVIPCRAPDSQFGVLDGGEKHQICIGMSIRRRERARGWARLGRSRDGRRHVQGRTSRPTFQDTVGGHRWRDW